MTSAVQESIVATPTIDPSRYISAEFARREKERLWPNVWQIACREEEIPRPGDYLTYEVGDQSIIVARTHDGEIVAYHNVCPHRGRRLVSGCGKAGLFRCGFHGWTFDNTGKNVLVLDRDDWGGGLDGKDLDLRRVRVDTWAGFVWIDMRDNGESLAEFLETVPDALDPFEYDQMRFRWYVTIHLPCNWKVALEAFIEGYHVAATHPQILRIMGDDYTQSYAHGKHSNFGYWKSQTPGGMPSPRLNQAWPEDPRPNVMSFFEEYETHLKAQFSERDYLASTHLMEAVPPETDPGTAFAMAVELGRKAAEAEGVGYPEGATFEHMARIGADWHIFPNAATLPWFDGAIFYRSRPDGDDPDKCIFDIWSLVRYAPGTEPPLVRQVFTDPSGNTLGQILNQDIVNMAALQKGMKSMAFTEGLPNPIQEVPVINFHKNLDRYLQDPPTRA